MSKHPQRATLTIKSDNLDYSVYDDIDPETTRFVGRIFWLGRRV